MSNASQPPENPWASQDPNWRPSQFGDARGRDPRQPFGQPPPEPQGYDYRELEAPRRPNRGMWFVLAAVAAVAALIVGMQFLGSPRADPTQPATGAPSVAAPSPTRTGNLIPFEGNGDGIFEIVGYSWSDAGLTLRVRIEVESGEYGFSLFAFTNETRESFDPVGEPAFTVRAGTPYEADVTFQMPRADATIVLATPSGRIALNALPVAG